MRFPLPIPRISLLLLAVLAAAGSTTQLQAQTYTSLTSDPLVSNHYPGADGLVGNGDDVVSAAVTSNIGSDPNYPAGYSYAAGLTPFGAQDPALPPVFDTVVFLAGSVSVDSAVAGAGGGSLFSGLNISTTQPVQGMNLALSLVSVNGGIYNPASGTLSVNLTLGLTILGLPVPLPVTNATLSATGKAWVVNAADFGQPAPTGNNYVDTVLVPRAAQLAAASLLFVDISGVEATTGVAYRIVYVGVNGVPTAMQADLSLTKTSPQITPQTPGTNITYRLSVTNNGPAATSGVVVTDVLPAGVNYLSNDCGAAAPVGALSSWTVGALAAMATAACNYTVSIVNNAHFDQTNGASAQSNLMDQNPANNTGIVATVVVGSKADGLLQRTNLSPPFLTPSDIDCDLCSGAHSGLADNFAVNSPITLQGIDFWGFYFNGATSFAPFADQFTIEIYDNKTPSGAPWVPGVPGNLVAKITGPVSRQATGNFVSGSLPEYRYRVATSLTLNRGTYWLLIHNDSSAGSASIDWFWAFGQKDALDRSLIGIGFTNRVPNIGIWTPNPNLQQAFQLFTGNVGGGGGTVAPIPALQPIMLLMLLLFLSALGVHALQKGKW